MFYIKYRLLPKTIGFINRLFRNDCEPHDKHDFNFVGVFDMICSKCGRKEIADYIE